jgi:hypothetical protein
MIMQSRPTVSNTTRRAGLQRTTRPPQSRTVSENHPTHRQVIVYEASSAALLGDVVAAMERVGCITEFLNFRTAESPLRQRLIPPEGIVPAWGGQEHVDELPCIKKVSTGWASMFAL